MVAAATLFFTPRRWWVFGAGAVVISQAVIFSSWGDAKVGTAANVVLLIAVLYGFASRGPLSLRSEFEHDLKRVRPSAQSSVRGPITEDDIAALPDPVQRYLRRSGAVGPAPGDRFPGHLGRPDAQR